MCSEDTATQRRKRLKWLTPSRTELKEPQQRGLLWRGHWLILYLLRGNGLKLKGSEVELNNRKTLLAAESFIKLEQGIGRGWGFLLTSPLWYLFSIFSFFMLSGICLCPAATPRVARVRQNTQYSPSPILPCIVLFLTSSDNAASDQRWNPVPLWTSACRVLCTCTEPVFVEWMSEFPITSLFIISKHGPQLCRVTRPKHWSVLCHIHCLKRKYRA